MLRRKKAYEVLIPQRDGSLKRSKATLIGRSRAGEQLVEYRTEEGFLVRTVIAEEEAPKAENKPEMAEEEQQEDTQEEEQADEEEEDEEKEATRRLASATVRRMRRNANRPPLRPRPASRPSPSRNRR